MEALLIFACCREKSGERGRKARLGKRLLLMQKKQSYENRRVFVCGWREGRRKVGAKGADKRGWERRGAASSLLQETSIDGSRALCPTQPHSTRLLEQINSGAGSTVRTNDKGSEQNMGWLLDTGR